MSDPAWRHMTFDEVIAGATQQVVPRFAGEIVMMSLKRAAQRPRLPGPARTRDIVLADWILAAPLKVCRTPVV
jgi:hypothetical protein